MFSSPGGGGGNKDDSSEDPTSILRVLGDFQSRMNKIGTAATSQRNRTSSGLQPAGSGLQAQRLRFDDSAAFLDTPSGGGNERKPFSTSRKLKHSSSHSLTSLMGGSQRLATSPFGRKMSRVEALEAGGSKVDPLEGLDYALDNPNVSRKRQRYPSAEEISALKSELERVKMKLVQKEAECMDAEANAKKSEALVKKMQVQVQKEAIENEAKVAKVRAEARKDKDKLLYLEDTLDSRRKRLDASKTLNDEQAGKLKESHDLMETRCQDLLERNRDLQSKVDNLEYEVGVYRIEERDEIVKLKQELMTANGRLESQKHSAEVEESAVRRMHEAQNELDKLRSDLETVKIERDEARSELSANEDVSVERRAVRHQLQEYPLLLKENKRLTEVNKLLIETGENTKLLKSQNEDLQSRLSHAEAKCLNSQETEHALNSAQSQLRKWQLLCRQLVSPGGGGGTDKYDLNSLGPATLSQKISELQQQVLEAKMRCQEQQTVSSAANDSVGEMHEQVEKLNKDLASAKNHMEQQASIIKRFKRKLLLTSKERDSFKGVLESYEHELTFTGGQFERDRLSALEAVVSNHKDTIEGLEAELAKALGVESIHAEQFLSQQSSKNVVESKKAHDEKTRLSHEVSQLKQLLDRAREEKEDLKYELERRAIKGDYDPTDTKVLHFRQNPTEVARGEHSASLDKLQSENDRLKARIKLLEEGHSQDLTMMVGHRVDQAASSQEVMELREQLKSKDLQKQRIIEAFQKTSQNFREVSLALTGYRIDGLQNTSQYRLTPVYAETQDDYLMFQREESGELHLLETPFSGQLQELMDLHLGQQNSVPVFLAAVLMDLFSRHTFDPSVSISVSAASVAHHQPLTQHREDDPMATAGPSSQYQEHHQMGQTPLQPTPDVHQESAAVGMHYQELQPSGGNVDDENVYEGQQQNPLMNVEEVRQLQAMAEENSGDESGEDYQQESDRESRRSRASSRSRGGDEGDDGDEEDDYDDSEGETATEDEEDADQEEEDDDEGQEERRESSEEEEERQAPPPRQPMMFARRSRPPPPPPPAPAANDDDSDDVVCIDSD